MDYNDLTTHFTESYDALKSEIDIDNSSISNSKFPIQIFNKEYLKHLIYQQVQEGLLHKLIGLPEKMEKQLRKGISFLVEEDKIKEFYLNELSELNSAYQRNLYAKSFSVDDFYKEIYDESNLDELCNKIINQVATSEKIFDENQEIDVEILTLTLKKEIINIELAFSFLIKAHLIKDKLTSSKEVATNLPENTKSRKLTRNQVVLLLDQLGLIHSLENVPHKNKQAQIISDITGYSSANVLNSLNQLDKTQKDLSVKYQKDLIKVDEYLKEFGLIKNCL